MPLELGLLYIRNVGGERTGEGRKGSVMLTGQWSDQITLARLAWPGLPHMWFNTILAWFYVIRMAHPVVD